MILPTLEKEIVGVLQRENQLPYSIGKYLY